MSTCTWTNGNATGLTNNDGNWSCGHVPTSADDVVFDATSTDNATADAAFDIVSLTVNSGYSGTLDLASYSHSVSGNVTFGGSGTVSLNTATLTLAGDFNSISQSTMTGSASTIVSNKVGASFEMAGINIFTKYANNITFNENAAGRFALKGTLTIASGKTFTTSSSSSMQPSGTLANNGILAASGSGSYNLYNLTISSIGSITAPIIFSSGGSNFTLSMPTVTFGDYVKFFNGGNYSSTFTVSFTGDATFNGDAVFDESVASRHVAVATNNNNLTFKGNVGPGTNTSWTWTKGTGTITLAPPVSTTSQINFNDLSVEDIEVDGAGTVQLTGGVVTDSINCINGTLDVNGQSLETVGNFTVGAGCTVTE